MTMQEDIRLALEYVKRAEQTGEIEARFCFDAGHAFFAGHFPGRPLLPGVFQIGLVLEAVAAATGAQYGLVRVVKAKFTDKVLPGETITLRAVFSKGPEPSVRATLWNPRGVAGKVSLVLRDRASRTATPAL